MSTKSAGRSALGVLVAGVLVGTAFMFMGSSPGGNGGDDNDDTVTVKFVILNPTERTAVNIHWKHVAREGRDISKKNGWSHTARVPRGSEVFLQGVKDGDPHTDLGCQIFVDGVLVEEEYLSSPWAAECAIVAPAEIT